MNRKKVVEQVAGGDLLHNLGFYRRRQSQRYPIHIIGKMHSLNHTK